jgi:hypothetical protein
VLGDVRLRDPEHLDQLADRPLPLEQQVEDPPSGRLRQHIERRRRHASKYASPGIYSSSPARSHNFRVLDGVSLHR